MEKISIHLHKKVAALAFEYPYEHAVMQSLFVLLGVLLAAYVYLVSASVLNVIGQREATQKSSSLESTIGSLEQHYFSLSEGISRESGSRLGLAPVKEKSYVYRLSEVGAVESYSNEI